jgi:regulator of RNase E activity RraA
VLSELEAQIASNVARKEREASIIIDGLVREMREAGELNKGRVSA